MQRFRIRVQRPSEATYSADSPPVPARIEDISESGCFIDPHHPPPVGTKMHLRFQLLDDPPSDPVVCDEKVVWMQPNASVYFGHDSGA